MSTSGTIDYQLTAAEVIERAYKRLGIIGGVGATVLSDEQTDAMDALNEMLKTWSMEGPNLWTRAEQTVTVVSGTQTYTLSPRPRFVYNARWCESGVERLPMTEWNRETWDKFIYKANTGTYALAYVLDKQRTSTTMTVWPIPTFSSGTYTIKVGYERAWEIVTDGGQNIDIPEELIETLIMCLAARLAELFQLSDPNVQFIRQRAGVLYQRALDFDRWGDVEIRVVR